MRVQIFGSNAFSLVEVTLALGVVSIGLATIIGLLSVAVGTSQRAAQAAIVETLLTAVAADLRATAATTDPAQPAVSQQFAISIPQSQTNGASISTLFLTESAEASTSITAQTRYRLTLEFLPNAGTRTATLVHLNLTWPAEAALSNATGRVNLLLALARK